MNEITKSIPVSKRMVWEAYLQVKKNRGGSGIDKISIEEFDAKLSSNLYKIWNRMASGSYIPPPVRTVFIPKKQGGKRPLGIPTVADRIAQTVVKQFIEPRLEKVFHANSFGYRPAKSAHHAVEQCKANCIKYSWVIDLDIKAFFDTIDHSLLKKMLEKQIQDDWALMYINRWMNAGVEQEDGSITARTMGTPQGGVISPLLANLFLHYAFDCWMSKQYPHLPFERYADDLVIHCNTRFEAENILEEIKHRMDVVSLSLNMEKTKIVYCKNFWRRQEYHCNSFTFLGFSFQPRSHKNNNGKGKILLFNPGLSNKAKQSIRESVREVLNPRWTINNLEYFAFTLNPKIKGWINYYSVFSKWEMYKSLQYINYLILKWIKNKFNIMSKKITLSRLKWYQKEYPNLFVHWKLGIIDGLG